jgi:DNA mismatch repair protein MutL|tara:strand:+ start:20214 stop:22019 length:1806 start_codon:yes stop_codon:yes gene_type:complete
MPRIQQLSERVANQIAAGEVVERPAAVVKELVENALDAGADHIEIEFRHGGKSYLRVTDDGCGMDEANALMSLKRHATSKLSEATDLLTLNSFGFRGEALPSIASVSRFSLRTREADAEEGVEITTDGSRPPEAKACGIAPGTTVEVSRLFHSVPVRRKFLKTDRTEAAHITLLCRLFAVAHPEISFTLLEDGQVRFRAAQAKDSLTRVREVFGKQLAADLTPLPPFEPDAASGGIAVSGLVAHPGKGRSTRAELFTFVNRRPVESRTLQYALIESYHTFIPKGRYPACFLFIELPSDAVDVNVHPTKREVRFRDDAKVRSAVMEALLATLKAESENVIRQAVPVTDARPLSTQSRAHLPAPPPSRPAQNTTVKPPQAIKPAPSLASTPAATPPLQKATPPPAPAPQKQQALSWTFLNLVQKRLALFESNEGLILLNLQAAQERIHFEEFLKQWDSADKPVQTLLFPASLEFDPIRSETLESNLSLFRSMGFTIEPFGRNFYRLSATPQAFTPEGATDFVRDLVPEIAERGLRQSEDDSVRKTIAQLAARKLSQRSENWDTQHVEALAQRLLRCEQPLSDPRGRPTFFELSRKEWERRLGL